MLGYKQTTLRSHGRASITAAKLNVFRCDRPRKGGVAIYVKTKCHATIQSSVSLSRQFELLALKLELLKGHCITVVGCYRPPSASIEALSSLSHQLSCLDFNEILIN